ncbi:MAG: ABC transporter permease subunit [Lachnospiraceae bacterium]|nr:ABC transporter permease subunit [Lachnospiraceae bacterium]
MNKLLQAGFLRIRKNRVFIGGLILSFLFIAAILIDQKNQSVQYGHSPRLDNFLFGGPIAISIILSVLCSLFVGTEYSDGTIRNKLIVGHTRTGIYFSNFILCVFAAALMYLVTLAAAFVLGIPLFGLPTIKLSFFLTLFVDGFLLCVAYAALYNMISMLCSSKSHANIICILAAFFLLMAGMILLQMLNAPETIPVAEYSINGEISVEEIANPQYLTGMKREIYQFFYDLLPGGQVLQLANLDILHPFRIAALSLSITILSSAAGCFFFSRKELK